MSIQGLHNILTEPRENTISIQDFEDNKVVFISDESHHVNTLTKKPNKDEERDINSWEYSVMRAFGSNKDNILLEFTATANLDDKNVKAKYLDKIVFNYTLKEFRKSGYTNLQRNNLKTLVDLQEHLEGFNKESKSLNKEIKVNKDKIKDLKSCLSHMDRIEKNKKIYQEWSKKIIFKEKFYKENEQAIKSYQYSAHRIEKITGERSINRKRWIKDIKELENKIVSLDRQKELNDDSAIKHIKYAIDHVNKE